ncbi:hypothetical protein HY492_04290 [Candidatus Woesearchaeota archaeon]|nr:hypothetical protein [Candidatus Woesearchaeota archaeon]
MKKPLLFAALYSAATVITVYIVQTRGAETTSACSYLDPIAIDVLAFAAALFLVVEGVVRIVQQPNDSWNVQAGRAIRIGFGCAIITIHVLQAIHK